MMSDRLALTILGGFLGAGKTTWLRHQLHTGRFADTHLIVNEAADDPVDDQLLARASGLTILAGGCACCAAQDRLAHLLRDLCDARSAGRGPRAVLLETSGLADPARIAAMIRADPVLIRHVTVAEIIVLVDAHEGPVRLRHEALARAQIRAADRVIVTKCDMAAPAQRDRVRATVCDLAPGAQVSAAEMGVDVSLPAADPAARAYDIGDADRAPIFAHVLDVAKTDWPVLSVWLSALIYARGDDIMRIKGVVQTPAGALLLQSVGRHMQPPEPLPAPPGRLVVIGRGTTQAALVASLERWGGTARAAIS